MPRPRKYIGDLKQRKKQAVMAYYRKKYQPVRCDPDKDGRRHRGKNMQPSQIYPEQPKSYSWVATSREEILQIRKDLGI
jgi:hypothetical protein